MNETRNNLDTFIQATTLQCIWWQIEEVSPTTVVFFVFGGVLLKASYEIKK